MGAQLGRRRLLAGGALAAAALAAGVAISAAGSGGESSAGSEEGSVATGTAEISRQDLVESETEDGTLGYADERTAMGTLAGTITWLPAEGTTVKTGRRLYQVDGENVYLLDGAVPVWRTLEPGLSGKDVLQLERSLRELGHDPNGAMSVDGDWDSATTAAVVSWQEAKGLDTTGTIELGRVVFQPGARRVSSTSVTLGGSSSGGTGGDSGTDGSSTQGASTSDGGGLQTTFASYTAAPSGDEEQTSTTEEQQDPVQPEDDAEQDEAAPEDQPAADEEDTPDSERQPDTGSDAAAAAGAATDSGDTSQASASSVMTTTSTRRIVTVELPTADAELAEKGGKVDVELPSGEDVRGRIASVGSVATLPDSEDAAASDATVTVKITLTGKADKSALDQAPVDVRFERSRRKDVLAIPVTALMARSGGRFAVELREGGTRRIVPVETGLYAGGYVEIEGAGLREGMSVTNAEV